MTRMTSDPWQLMRLWQDDLSRGTRTHLAQRDESNVLGGDWTPAIDIKEEEDRYVLHADIPGVEPEKIELSMEDGMLTIKGEKRHEVTENKEGYKRVERSYGSFYRRFSLPDNTDPELIKASGKDGVLEVIIPKVEAKRSKKIEIQPKRGS
ncbi:MAG: Hsp20/alpha crystallin family protein [Sedimenticola sp.]|nr:Hsp20/alpha crystallin family protein [Sedimenticola sp.]MCW8921240.1 Hsp20/alpha crystallin family protein [Sedimenticola sp.]MCW8947932.1 Hsp20/alpha crystallin family protein [Sedimenticola sp.]MCW8975958.1 Hsp20/alpha crystallin family protein [Sedimenticola sp.]MDF1528315.1 Hsp20/alpha crystallin family protein [Sedimenticola sp.]